MADPGITPNYRGAEISQIAEAVSIITGKNFIIDPRVNAQVTMMSVTPMSPVEFYEAFLSMLQVHGYVAIPAGPNIIKIVPEADARTIPTQPSVGDVKPPYDQLVTQIIGVKNIPAGQLVPVLRPLIPQYGHIAAPTSNLLIISDRSANVERIKAIVERIDQTSIEVSDDTQVIYLKYGDAEKIAAKLKEQLQSGKVGETQIDTSQGVTIWADPETNAIVITAPPRTMRSITTIISRLDIRRAQVLVEAILVEMSTDKARDFGINWMVSHTGSDGKTGRGGYINPVDGVSLGDVVRGDAEGEDLIPQGLTLGIGKIVDIGTSWTALIRAIESTAGTNIIATPSIIALDNEEAEIKIAQEVPFVTGQYVNTQANVGTVNPFQTITRAEVGNILKITPQINEGDAVLLKVSQEASNLSPSKEAVDLITNKRTISTKVMVEDGGIIVLGGLISDQVSEGKQQVPFLGSIPGLGELFKTRQTTKTKTNLMVFIRPVIIRDGTDADNQTNAKYNYIREQQQQHNGGKVQLMPNEHQPALPSIETVAPKNDPLPNPEN